LTNDTGTMHLAAWLGVPVAAVFGSTDPDLTGPAAPAAHVRILRHQVVCSPCFLAECPLDFRCMKAVSPDEAAAALVELSGHVPAPARG
jgi:heptosyltransferase-2